MRTPPMNPRSNHDAFRIHRPALRTIIAASAALLLTGGPIIAQTLRARSTTAPPSLRSAPLNATMDLQVQLAGVETIGFPHFTYVRAFNAGAPVRIAIDPFELPGCVGHHIDVYVTAHRSPAEWVADPTLVDETGGPLLVTPVAGSRARNVVVLDAGTLNGVTGTTEVGVGYDVVLDFNRNGILDRADRIDGWGAEAGLYVMPNMTKYGPHTPRERLYNGGTLLRQDVYYPAGIAALGQLPVVIISHGNGHNYQWYDHLGKFLASWGYIVMSHTNNTGPGIETASTTTLRNTDHFLRNLDIIANGALEGHVDKFSIVWMGHSRGGEGVARAYKRLVAGTPLAKAYGPANIKLVSSIAPTDFLGVNRSNPLGVPFHLWTGGADADVNGCAASDIAQTFHLHDRAQGLRLSTSFHGVGHGDFHDGGGSSVATGPCLIGRVKTHLLMKGYVLPLLKHVLEGNVPCKDYLWRQWESLKPLGAPVGRCVVVDLMYQGGPDTGKRIIDDFQSNPSTVLSSSGGAVEIDAFGYDEGLLNDRNNAFTYSPLDPMNGMTLGGSGDTTAGVVFSWAAGEERAVLFEVRRDIMDVSDYDYLSFRAAQVTRTPPTVAQSGDLTFSVELFDLLGRRSMIQIGAYGGGIEEPYQRGACGVGVGWANEWETIRIPLADFKADGRQLETRGIIAIAFRFGTGFGSAFGRIGLDEIEFTNE